MNTEHIDTAIAVVTKPHVRAVIRNSAGQTIFDSVIDRNWQGYIVREIQEIRDGNNALPSTYREFSGTYVLTLEGVGGVRYTLTDNQEHALPLCLMQKPGQQPVLEFAPRGAGVLCFNDNKAEFYD